MDIACKNTSISCFIFLAGEFYSQRQLEIINFYSKYFKTDPEFDNYTRKYVSMLRSCQDLGSSDPPKREHELNTFPNILEELNQYRDKVGVDLFEAAIQQLFSMIDILFKGLRWQRRAGGLDAAYFVLKKFNY